MGKRYECENVKKLNLPSFTVDNLNIPTVTELPAAWDRKEDSIYDTVYGKAVWKTSSNRYYWATGVAEIYGD